MQRRRTQWAGFGDINGAANIPTLTPVTNGSTAIIGQAIIIQGSSGLVDEEFTITRMIGFMTAVINSTTSSAIGSMAVGCLVARNEAVAAGVASLPSPEADPDSDWLYYASMVLRNPANAETNGPVNGKITFFDVRGQRIVRNGETLVWLASANDSNMVVAAAGRYLVKLP